MLLLARLILFAMGFLFRFLPPLFGVPEMQTTKSGLKFGVRHSHAKNGTITKTEIWIPLEPKLRFRLQDETPWTEFCQTIGFGQEFRISSTPSHEFDRRFYIASDNAEFLNALKNDEELQNVFLRLRGLGFETFNAHGTGYLKLPYPGEYNLTEQTKGDLEILWTKLKSVSVSRVTGHSHFAKLMVLEAILYGAVAYGGAAYFSFMVDSGLVHLDLMPVVAMGLGFGLLFLLVWMLAVYFMMKRSAYAPLLVSDFLLAGLLIVVSAGPMFASDLNRTLDESAPNIYRAGIYDSYSRTTGTGKNRRTRHYLSLKYIDNPMQLPQEFEIGFDRDRFAINQGIEFEIRDGFLGMKYIDRLNSIPFPEGLVSPTVAAAQTQYENNLLVLSAIQENVAWRRQMKSGSVPDLAEVVEVKYQNGNLKSREHFYRGMKQGASVYYHVNGTTYTSIDWKDGARHGSFKVFREDGSLEQWTSYKDGKPHGLFAWFNEQGATDRPTHLRIYNMGQVIEGDRETLLPIYLELMHPTFSEY